MNEHESRTLMTIWAAVVAVTIVPLLFGSVGLSAALGLFGMIVGALMSILIVQAAGSRTGNTDEDDESEDEA